MPLIARRPRLSDYLAVQFAIPLGLDWRPHVTARLGLVRTLNGQSVYFCSRTNPEYWYAVCTQKERMRWSGRKGSRYLSKPGKRIVRVYEIPHVIVKKMVQHRNHFDVELNVTW